MPSQQQVRTVVRGTARRALTLKIIVVTVTRDMAQDRRAADSTVFPRQGHMVEQGHTE